MYKLDELTEYIKCWAYDRKLETGEPHMQVLKLAEETGEVAQAIGKGKYSEVLDEIGDVYVVITILAMQLGINLEDCVELAYNKIKERKGELRNGVFVKEGDL